MRNADETLSLWVLLQALGRGGMVEPLDQFDKPGADFRVGERDVVGRFLRAAGVSPRLVEGSRDNIKITSPGDEHLAAALLQGRISRGAWASRTRGSE